MAIGSVVSNVASVSAGAYLDIQPSSTVEWCIHNILYGGATELYIYDGADLLKFDSDATFGGRLGLTLHCTNTIYYRVKNVSSGAFLIGYDGVQTK